VSDNAVKQQTRSQGPRIPGSSGPGEKAKDFKGAIKKLLNYMKKYRIALIVGITFAVLSAAFNIFGPRILSGAITELFNGLVMKNAGTGGIDFDKIAGILISLALVYIVALVCGIVQGWMLSTIAQKTSYDMRKQISEKIHRMPVGYFERNSVGDVLSRITNDVDMMTQTLGQSVTQLVLSTASLVGALIMMLIISPTMTLIAIAILPVSILVVVGITKFSQKFFFRQQEYLGKVNGQVEEEVSGHSVVKLFNHEDESMGEFNDTNDKLYDAAWKSQFFSGLVYPLINLVGNMGYVGVAVLGGLMAFRGSITVGDIQAFVVYIRNFTQPITMMSQVVTQLQTMAAASERVFEFLEEEEEVPDADGAAVVGGAAGGSGGDVGRVTFENVRFGYDPEKIIIKNFSQDVKPGQMVAIVGPTGAGKTTLVKLLMRFYDVNAGAIIVDGNEIRTIRRASLRNDFAMVLQDTWLFKGTIMENIKYGKQDATDEEAIEAAKAAYVDQFVRALPDGYNMMLSEDADNISTGQKQLLTIARAILAESPMLILDEATSSVDTRTEALIQKAMNNLKAGRTSFVIAHRLSTIKDADIILVMNEGDVIEQGTHDDLLAAGGFYADLYMSQFDTLEEE